MERMIWLVVAAILTLGYIYMLAFFVPAHPEVFAFQKKKPVRKKKKKAEKSQDR